MKLSFGAYNNGCGRNYCSSCGEELIHRDFRKSWESSSAFGAIIRRRGPKEIAVGDIDAYIYKTKYGILRIVEHKQLDAKIGSQQNKSLHMLATCIKAGIDIGCVDPRSGVFLIRGNLHGCDHGRREVDFDGQQYVRSLDDDLILQPKTPRELWDWINGDSLWTPRKGIARIELRK